MPIDPTLRRRLTPDRCWTRATTRHLGAAARGLEEGAKVSWWPGPARVAPWRNCRRKRPEAVFLNRRPPMPTPPGLPILDSNYWKLIRPVFVFVFLFF